MNSGVGVRHAKFWIGLCWVTMFRERLLVLASHGQTQGVVGSGLSTPPFKCSNVRSAGHREDFWSCLCSFSATLEIVPMQVSRKNDQLFLMGKVLYFPTNQYMFAKSIFFHKGVCFLVFQAGLKDNEMLWLLPCSEELLSCRPLAG